MKKFLLVILAATTAFGATENMRLDTNTHYVQKPGSSLNALFDIDFSQVTVGGLDFPLPFQTILLSGGGVAWTGTGLDFTVSAATYLINGVQYSSPQTNITLTPADVSNDRIDVFAVTTSSTAVVIDGIPAGPPLEPQVDPATQLRLTSVQVNTGSTTPVITNENIYLENTEYTMSTNSAGTINLASLILPFAGTKDIEGTLTVAGNFFTGVKPSGTLDLSAYQSLVFQIRSKAQWQNAKAISVFWLNGSTVIGTSAAVRNGTFGFNSATTSTYQQIVIPTSTFGTGSAAVDRVRFAVTGAGAAIGWYIDNIILQTGTGGPPTGGDFSTNTTTSVANEIVLFADTTGKLGKRSTGTGVANITSGVLGTVTIGTGLSYVGSTLSSTISAGAPSTTDYLVGTSDAGLSNEIVVGTTPGGELGGTWASPTLDDGVTVTGWELGASTATTAAANDNDTSLATTAYTQAELTAYASDTVTFTNKRITKRSTSVSNTTSWSINTDNFDYADNTGLTGTVTIDTTGTPTVGQTLWISVTGTAARTISWDASDFESSTVTLPTTTVSTSRLDCGFIWNPATSKWRCVASQ